jgi:hypothetical protein
MEPTVEAICLALRAAHREARELVGALGDAALYAQPNAPETNAIATLVLHAVRAEMQIVRQVAGVASPRDRDAEFALRPGDVDLLAELTAADTLLLEVGSRITAEHLDAPVERSGGRVMSGRRWLLSAFGHFNEHLGEARLTRQLLSS